MAQLKKITSIKLDEDTNYRINNLAQKRDRSPHYIMQIAIADFLEREEKIEKFREDAQSAYDEYALTGEYIAHSDADEWLNKLENGIISEPPK